MENKSLKKLNWPLLILILSAIALFLTVTTLSYLKLIKTNLANDISLKLENNQNDIVSTIDNTLPIYYETLNDKFNSLNKKEINNKALKEAYDSLNNTFLGVGFYEKSIYEDNNELSLNKKSYYYDGKLNDININFNQNYSFDKIESNKISLINLNSFFIEYLNDTKIYAAIFYYPYSYDIEATHLDGSKSIYTYNCYFYGLYDMTPYIESSLKNFYNAKSVSFAIMNDSGLFFQTSLAYDNLKSYLNEKANYYIDLLQDNTSKDVIIETITNGDNTNFLVSKRILLDYNDLNLYFLAVVNDYYFEAFYRNINDITNVYAIFMAVSIILGILISILLIYKITNIFSLSRYKLKYTNNYVIICKNNGKILFMNNLFKKEIENSITYKNINQFEALLDDNSISLLKNLKTLKPFIAEFIFTDNQRKYIHFIVLKNKGTYLLLGDLEFSKQYFNKKVEELAYADKLTSLANINSLTNILSKYTTLRNENDNKSIIYIDIIKFKKYNVLFGVEFGNEVICKLASMIKEFKDNDEQLFALGGDKFVLFVNKFIEYECLNEGRCKDLYDFLTKPFSINLNEIKLDIAMGIFNIDYTKYPTITPSDIIKNAEIAASKAKNYENRKICIFDNGIYQIIKRDEIIAQDIEKGIENNEFVVYFQPQFDLKNNVVSGFESLLRWNNEKYKNDSPYEYIRIAEKKGLIVAISKQILKQSFMAAKDLMNKGYKAFHISVNISIAQLMKSGFVNEFISYYKEYDLPYSFISIEITETMLITSFDEVKDKLEQIRKYGIKVYIDDFGMGYSSLLYLNDLPVDYIKIDKEFIKHLQHNRNSRIIVSKLIAMAKELDLQVVAEGVETQYQVNFLRKNKCQFIQGWIISKAKDISFLDDMMNISKNFCSSNDEKEDNNDKFDINVFNQKTNQEV